MSQNVGSSIDTPIISRQASIVYMGVTYRCMGVSYGLGTGKERSFFMPIPEGVRGVIYNIEIMKKLLIILWCGLALYSCIVPTTTTQTAPKQPIACLVDTFVATHPNFMNNEITREQANVEWKQAVLDSLKNPHFLDSIRLTMIGINKTKKNGYVAHFRSNNNDYSYGYKNINSLHFDVLTCVSDSIALTLVENADYIVFGQIISPIDFPTMQVLYGAPLNRYTDDYSITESYREGIYDIQMANLMMDINDFRIVQ